jgi:hypothetical protein
MKRMPAEITGSRRDVGLLHLAGAAQQVDRKQCPFRRFLMLEVGKDIAAGGQMLSDPRDHCTALFFRVTRLAKSVIDKRSVTTSGVVRSSVSATQSATPWDFNKSHVESENQDSWRNSNAAGNVRGRSARKSLSSAASDFQIRRQLKQHGPSFPALANGSIVARKRGRNSSVPFNRLICVITWCALMPKRKCAGVS